MTVKEAKQILDSVPDDTLVVLSSDAEGNSYSPLAGYSNGKYVPESGEFYETIEIDGEDAIALYPV